MKKYLQQIDIQRLAGIKTILGIDLTENRVRVVEIQQHGNIFNRFDLKLKALHAFALEFPQGSSLSDRANTLKAALVERGIKTKYAVSSIQSLGVKNVETAIPSGTRDINEWINEQQEKLLRLPVSSNQILHAYEVVDQNENGLRVEISFVRAEEVQNYQSFFQQAGLQLISLGVGAQDAPNVLYVSQSVSDNVLFGFLQSSKVTLTRIQKGKRVQTTVEECNADEQLSSILSVYPENKKVICGDALPSSLSSLFLKPLDLASEYALAVGLAIKGFMPDINPISLLTNQAKEYFHSGLYKSLFQRTVIALGSLILGILFLQIVVDYYIASRIENLDQQLLTNGSAYAEVQSLEKQVKELVNQASGTGALTRSSHISRLMHDLARATIDGLWFYRVKVDQSVKGQNQVFMYGYTTSNEKVAEFLRSLTEKGFDVNLIRSGNPQQNETLIPVRNGRQFTTFEIKVMTY